MVTQIQKFKTSRGTLLDSKEEANKIDIQEKFYDVIKKFGEEERYPDPIMLALWLSNEPAIASQLQMILLNWQSDRTENNL